MSTEQPKVGDKVVYVPNPAFAHLPLREPWGERAERPSLVTEGPDGDGDFWCRPLRDGGAWVDRDEWLAPPERLRVVGRATYERVGEVSDGPR
jgi:hypothetical protein